MKRCPVHGIQIFGSYCKRCKAEGYISQTYNPPPFAPTPNSDSDILTPIIMASMLTTNLHNDQAMPERSMFEGGESGGGGASREWDSEPTDNSSSYDSSSSSSDSGSSSSSDN